jgi:nucleoside-diphosphate-sugar epimerase
VKVLLTGASGFVGSHILDSLRVRSIAAVLLLRKTSSRQFIQTHLPDVEVCEGSLSEPASLAKALDGVSHVIHCAGCTRVSRYSEFHTANHLGARAVVEAVNTAPARIERLIHISSLAATGPATADRPAREMDVTRPISEYGRSKLAGELEVRHHCRAPFTILRPPAVYGPRDIGFLSIFKAVKYHVLPRTNPAQMLSLVFARDLAEACARCLEHPATAGKIYFVTGPEVVSGASIGEEIAAQMGKWTVPCPLWAPLLWPLCLAHETLSKLTGRPGLLNLQKLDELRAPGWVCDGSRLVRDIGFECGTTLKAGIAETLAWYREHQWL